MSEKRHFSRFYPTVFRETGVFNRRRSQLLDVVEEDKTSP